MEEFGILIVLALLAVFIILPIWVISSILRLRRELEEERRQSVQHWQDLTARLYLLETKAKEAQEAERPSPAEPIAVHEAHAAPTAAKVIAPTETAPLRTPGPPPVPTPRPEAPILREPEPSLPKPAHELPPQPPPHVKCRTTLLFLRLGAASDRPRCGNPS